MTLHFLRGVMAQPPIQSFTDPPFSYDPWWVFYQTWLAGAGNPELNGGWCRSKITCSKWSIRSNSHVWIYWRVRSTNIHNHWLTAINHYELNGMMKWRIDSMVPDSSMVHTTWVNHYDHCLQRNADRLLSLRPVREPWNLHQTAFPVHISQYLPAVFG